MYTCEHRQLNRRLLLWMSWLVLVFGACQQQAVQTPTTAAPFLAANFPAADSLLQALTIEEKLGQLLYWEGDSIAAEQIGRWVEKGQLGGLQLPGYQLETYLQLTDSLRELSKLPLFFGTSQPALLFDHFRNLPAFPQSSSLAAIRADSTEQQLAALFAAQCKAVGINLVQAPQVSKNPKDEVAVNDGKYPDDSFFSLSRDVRLTRALLAEKILPIGQTIPALLSANADSLAVAHTLAPFRALTRRGICGWAVADDVFPIDTTGRGKGPVLKNYLDRHLGFDGLVVSSVKDTSELLASLLAGSDLVKIRHHPESYLKAMKQWLQRGVLTELDINERLTRLWKAKAWVDQPRDDQGTMESIEQWLTHDFFDVWRAQLFQQATTLANDPQCQIPLENIHRQRFVVLTVGEAPLEVFPKYVEKYVKVSNQFYRHPDFPVFPTRALQRAQRSTVFFVLNQVQLDTVRHQALIQTINELATKTRLVLVNFGHPGELRHFDSNISMLQLHEQNELTEQFAAQAIFGGIALDGQLPVRVADHLPAGRSLERGAIRLAYTSPEMAGVASYRLAGIDAIMRQAIQTRALPGGQIFVVKSGRVIYDKSFGYHTYRKRRPIQATDLYDIASITKVASTTLAVMRLEEQGRIRLEDKLRKHLPLTNRTRVGGISVQQLLSHRSGLSPNMPLNQFISAKKRKRWWFNCNDYYCQGKGEEPYTVALADSLYLDPRWVDSIWQKVYRMRVSKRKRVRYSDVNFNLLQKLVETKTQKGLDQYLFNTIYRPLHLRRTTYRPVNHFPKKQLVPTARDQLWRHQLIHGYVHDESAALLSGVGGNAGLFATAADLGVLFQMLLNGGQYGGRQFFKPATIAKFTQPKQNQRRAYGFERKTRRHLRGCSSKASLSTYGHTGFTGGAVWVDPEEELVFVFLTNRIHPDPKNARIFNKKIRERIHSVVYEALESVEWPDLPAWKSSPRLPVLIVETPEKEVVRAGR